MSRKNTIKEAIFLAKQNKTITAEKTMAMLYALADKFLNGAELDEIKEAVTMTRLGEMIFADGMVKGEENTLKNMIQKKPQKNKSIPVIAQELELEEDKVRSLIEKLESEAE